MAQRYQEGHIRKAKRKSGAVWEFLWRETAGDGIRRQRTLVVGPLRELPTKREALAQIQTLRHNINNSALPAGLITFDALYRHYCETELLAENKTPKTRETYRMYLRKWILPRWESDYLHNIKTVAVEQWLRSLPLANGSKAKIRNIMSAIFRHAIRYEMTEKNPISLVRQSGKREKVPVILEVAELHRLFDELQLRERTMIICDALTGIRRSELMGLKWMDLDFMRQQINIVRSVVDQSIGSCKTEASKKPVPMDEHLARVLLSWRQESAYTGPEDWVWASAQMAGKQPLWLSTIMRYYIQPAAKRAGVTKQSAGTPSGTRSQL